MDRELEYIIRTMTAPLTVRLACVGLGQAGGKIVDRLAGMVRRDGQPYYSTGAVNSFAGDLAALQHVPFDRRLPIRGVEAGGGRMPEVVRSALLNPETENQAVLYDFLDTVAGDSPYLMLAAGLGGGTGTGIIWGLLDWIRQGLMPRPCGLVLTLPRPEDGPRQTVNAAQALRAIVQHMAQQPSGPLHQLTDDDLRRRINSLILVDNGLLYRQWCTSAKAGDWMTFGNVRVAEGFHAMNVLASNAAADVNFDSADFGKLLLYSGGCVTYGRVRWSGPPEYGKLAEDAREAVAEGLFSTGYDLTTATFWGGIALRAGEQQGQDARIREAVESSLRFACPRAEDYKLGSGQWNHNVSSVYLGVSGLAMPPRVGDIIRGAAEEQDRLKRAEDERAARNQALLDGASVLEAPREVAVPLNRPVAPAANPFRKPPVQDSEKPNPFRKGN